MAHPNLHISVGMALGIVLVLPLVMYDVLRGRPLARALGWLLVASYGLALLALIPRALGLHDAAWLDAFALVHQVDRWKPDGRGLLVGELGIAACIALQYLLVVAALVQQHYRARRPAAPGPRGE